MGSKAREPEAPDVAKASRDGVLADLLTLPGRRQAELAAQLGQKASIDVPQFDASGNFTGMQKLEVDFTGAGDAIRQQAQIEQDRIGADAQAKSILDIQSKYGNQFVDQSLEQLRRADPAGFAARDELGRQIQEQLAAGGALTAGEQRGVEQSVRASQAARGNILGVSAATQEVMASDAYRQQKQQRAFSNAGSFINGSTPQGQFGTLQAAQGGAAPYAPVSFQRGMGLDPKAGLAGQNFASNIFSTQAQIYQTSVNKPNPFMEVAGMAAGVAGSMMCWVAREVYGEDNPKWKQFREWVCKDAPEWFHNLYLKYGERIAAWVRVNPWVKPFLRRWMDSKIA
ncbi:MAG: hypothetical protein ACO39R_06480, partial [Pontimonas sp.]